MALVAENIQEINGEDVVPENWKESCIVSLSTKEESIEVNLHITEVSVYWSCLGRNMVPF